MKLMSVRDAKNSLESEKAVWWCEQSTTGRISGTLQPGVIKEKVMKHTRMTRTSLCNS